MEDILKKYKSSILHLRIIKKTDFGVVLEPLMGHECFLHISHISRDIERGKALHSLLNVGDHIDAVLMRINPRYNSFDVSTKVFEEHNSTIHPTKCRKIIDERLRRRTSKDEHDLKEYRSILNRLLSDLNREGETFAFELLQNADDYPNKIYDNKVRITFELKNEYLLVKHDGSPFNESNVDSICSILLGDQERLGDENRIGYKGIGFKSVFHYTCWAYIHSGNFSFRFDKNAEIFKEFKNQNILPWEVMPVITDEKDVIKKINDYEFFNKPVGFALKVGQKDQESIIETLEKPKLSDS